LRFVFSARVPSRGLRICLSFHTNVRLCMMQYRSEMY
jgi:hypothetical protein